MAARLTVVSNGHGEDAIGAALARELHDRRPDLEILAFPLVGSGSSYRSAGVPTRGVCRPMPSAGLMLHSWSNFEADLRAGWLGVAAAQARSLARHRTYVLVIVGDLFAQLLAATVRSRARFVYQPLVSVLQAGESRPPLHRLAMERFTYPERLLMRHRADRVYVRDEPSAAWLRDHGVPHAVSLGNPAMDAVLRFGSAGDRGGGNRVALLPGSRAHSSRSLGLMLSVVEHERLDAAVSWALPHPPAVAGWAWRPAEDTNAVLGALVRGSTVVRVFDRKVGAALSGARIALATAGTAAEQAAAAGVPVVSFPLPPEHTRDFLAGQERLLGDALTVVAADRSAIAGAARSLFEDDAAHATAAEAGRRRMGGPGGTRAIAEDLLAHTARLEALRG